MKALLIFTAVILAIFALWIIKLISYSSTIRYLKIEINRALSREEKKYWKRELKMIYLHCLPFGWIITKCIDWER